MCQVLLSARYRPFPTLKVSVSDRLVKTGIDASLSVQIFEIMLVGLDLLALVAIRFMYVFMWYKVKFTMSVGYYLVNLHYNNNIIFTTVS